MSKPISEPGKAKGAVPSGGWANSNYDRTLNWRDIDWVREHWGGKIVLKGILDVEDAKRAASAGVDGIVVSNHGGRQLDGARSSIAALPAIVDAVGDRLEVLLDGGVRSGQDVSRRWRAARAAADRPRVPLWPCGGGEAGVQARSKSSAPSSR